MDDYEHLLEAAKREPANADFLALRLAYTRSAHFNPYMNSIHTPGNLRGAMHQDNQEKIGAAIQRVLHDDYLDIETHIIAHNFYRLNGKSAKADYHARFAVGLLQSIMSSDGRTYETAFNVLSIREEYAVMGYLGLPVHMQRKASYNGGDFDILTTQHPSTGEDLDFYFNIDLMRTYFHRSPESAPLI